MTPAPATPAARLREAAGVVRRKAAAVSTPDPADMPFHADGTDVTQGRCGLYDVATAQTPELAAWIALMHPGVGEPLAAWLEKAAKRHDAFTRAATEVFPDDLAARAEYVAELTDAPALALADAILAAVTS